MIKVAQHKRKNTSHAHIHKKKTVSTRERGRERWRERGRERGRERQGQRGGGEREGEEREREERERAKLRTLLAYHRKKSNQSIPVSLLDIIRPSQARSTIRQITSKSLVHGSRHMSISV